MTSSSPTVLLDAVTAGGVPARLLSTAESISLLEALAAVPEPCKRRGRRHSLQSILFLALGAVVAGAGSYAAIADWAAVTEQEVRVCADPPHATTFRRLLSRLDPVALQAALTGWVLGCRDAVAAQAQADGGPVAKRRCVLAADGKTLRGARGPDGAQPKVFGVYDQACQLVLTQTAVVDGDEIAAFTAALATLSDLHGVVLTADALHCQREHAHWLHARGGHYLFTVKANQPTLRRALAALAWAQAPRSRRREAAHGRTESRSIKVIDKVVRRRREQRTGKTSTETVYAITPLNHRQADPGLLAGWIQGHWGIENQVHHVPDVTPGEDASRIRTGTTPQVRPSCATPRSTCTASTDTPTSPAPNAEPAGEPAAPTPPSTPHDDHLSGQVNPPSRTLPRP